MIDETKMKIRKKMANGNKLSFAGRSIKKWGIKSKLVFYNDSATNLSFQDQIDLIVQLF